MRMELKQLLVTLLLIAPEMNSFGQYHTVIHAQFSVKPMYLHEQPVRLRDPIYLGN